MIYSYKWYQTNATKWMQLTHVPLRPWQQNVTVSSTDTDVCHVFTLKKIFSDFIRRWKINTKETLNQPGRSCTWHMWVAGYGNALPPWRYSSPICLRPLGPNRQKRGLLVPVNTQYSCCYLGTAFIHWIPSTAVPPGPSSLRNGCQNLQRCWVCGWPSSPRWSESSSHPAAAAGSASSSCPST